MNDGTSPLLIGIPGEVSPAVRVGVGGMEAHPDGDVFFLKHIDGQQKLGKRSRRSAPPSVRRCRRVWPLSESGEARAGARSMSIRLSFFEPSGGRVLKKSRSPVVIC